MKRICFTGHRNARITPTLKKFLVNDLESLIYEGAEIFAAGGSRGWDNDCSDVVLELKEKYPQIKLHIIMPCPEVEQTADWTEADRAQYRRILSLADHTELCSEHKTNDCMKKRNARMTELADCCICYLKPNRKRSGTHQTVRMAQEKGIEIINLYDYEVMKEAVGIMLEEYGRELEEKSKDKPDTEPSREGEKRFNEMLDKHPAP